MQKLLSRIVYAGDRDIAVWVLRFIIKRGIKPIALMIPDKSKASCTEKLVKLCSHLSSSYILEGNRFRTRRGIELLSMLKPDYILCVHFPYIIPREILKIPKQGVINLHPAYLPYNRGWHTPIWAIYQNVPYGATLHFMDEGIDTGDIIHRKQMPIGPGDTAHSIYKKVKKLEFEVFKETWPSLLSGTYSRTPQSSKDGTVHNRKDIELIQYLDINKQIKPKTLIRQLRALTTNNKNEAAYYRDKDKIYRIQVRITENSSQKRASKIKR